LREEDMAIGPAAVLAVTPRSGLADRVYEQVKARILLGQDRPGDVIAAHALAQELEVSRTPVHEGLKRLVGEGYLVTRPRIGYAVTPVNLDEMRDLFQVRTRLEALAAELAARAWREERRAAFRSADRAAQRRHKELGLSGTPLELAQFLHAEHKRFHRMIADIGGNRRLERLICELQDETQRFWSLLPADQLVSRVFLADPAHRAILDAIASKDPASARAAVIAHLREGVRLMVEAVVPEQPPADDLGA
jgi:DNA-binding GntR family transcriptional regulator